MLARRRPRHGPPRLFTIYRWCRYPSFRWPALRADRQGRWPRAQIGALRFTEEVEALDVRLRFTLRTLSLVHHRRRSLKTPQQGEVRFLFGDSTTPDLRSMAEALGLLSTAERNGTDAAA